MRRVSIILIVIVAVGIGGFAMSRARVAQPHLPVRTVTVGEATVRAEVATTAAQQEQGLSGRAALAPGDGMLFVFPAPSTYGFWMKDMRFPLDFVYVNGGTVVALKENVPVPAAAPTPFFPAARFDAVLEVNAGWIAAHRVTVGAAVAF